ncbi:MAG: hypothetical protein ABS43_05970 [Bordetella sp. SCN 67-23]|nr:IclR family transcriptional regulator [Burkholderiales bacterium]ODS75347.1 MAG: hypothetical protein ABS43_05970 [Bordetella sp. SCN 67-23]ODU76415.1 MAG: hypothetical protein ABT00_15385 [Bordetella sp. SCN 68-11]OJW88703.1 MAG: hypothetical protein BGO71_04515 [Burkholderiales bacterium 67-32]
MDKTVVKALSILETLSNSDRPRGVTELAAEVDMTKANVHRLLRTLLALGYVSQNEASAYQLSLKMWELGSRRVAGLDLIDVAKPVVRQLCAQVNESVQLLVPEKLSVVCVDKAESAQPLRATTVVGSRVPIHAVSGGKAVLAFSPEVATALAYPLEAYTSSTITSQAAMEDEMAYARKHGYAINRGEWRPGIWGIAAPIYNAQSKVTGAICVWGAETRMSGEATARLGACVAAAAARISGDLGCVNAGVT